MKSFELPIEKLLEYDIEKERLSSIELNSLEKSIIRKRKIEYFKKLRNLLNMITYDYQNIKSNKRR